MYTAYCSDLTIFQAPSFRTIYEAARRELRYYPENAPATAVLCSPTGTVICAMFYAFRTLLVYTPADFQSNHTLAGWFKPELCGDESGKLYELVTNL